MLTICTVVLDRPVRGVPIIPVVGQWMVSMKQVAITISVHKEQRDLCAVRAQSVGFIILLLVHASYAHIIGLSLSLYLVVGLYFLCLLLHF